MHFFFLPLSVGIFLLYMLCSLAYRTGWIVDLQGSSQSSEQQKVQEEAKREAEEQRQMMLTQILTSEARARLARIALVKPDKARGVEDVILRAAQMGQIAGKVSEERLITLLEQINTQTTKETKVTIKRRQNVLDDE
ncbi:hypothetical protein Pfo_023461 [Paulownia fortunei]|nr:hypothetical protein Pfo_023461 [Paulownia fortunei]